MIYLQQKNRRLEKNNARSPLTVVFETCDYTNNKCFIIYKIWLTQPFERDLASLKDLEHPLTGLSKAPYPSDCGGITLCESLTQRLQIGVFGHYIVCV
jgi:hypothetical protein